MPGGEKLTPQDEAVQQQVETAVNIAVKDEEALKEMEKAESKLE